VKLAGPTGIVKVTQMRNEGPLYSQVGQSTNGESHHSDMLPSCRLRSSQKTCAAVGAIVEMALPISGNEPFQSSRVSWTEKLVFRDS